MTRHIWPLLLLVAGPLRAVYQYEITDSFASIDTNKWYVNGTVSLGGGISSSPGDDPAPQGHLLRRTVSGYPFLKLIMLGRREFAARSHA